MAPGREERGEPRGGTKFLIFLWREREREREREKEE
jgi:hypothetical protein